MELLVNHLELMEIHLSLPSEFWGTKGMIHHAQLRHNPFESENFKSKLADSEDTEHMNTWKTKTISKAPSALGYLLPRVLEINSNHLPTEGFSSTYYFCALSVSVSNAPSRRHLFS